MCDLHGGVQGPSTSFELAAVCVLFITGTVKLTFSFSPD